MVILVRYAEIGIKGKNRERFERALSDNIERCLRKHDIPFSNVRRIYGRIIIETDDYCKCLRHVFGIASFSKAVRAGSTIDELVAASGSLVSGLSENDSFRVSCQRLDKKFPLTSRDVCVQLGEKLRAITPAKVRMVSPTVDVSVEVIDGCFYLMTSRTEGPGGMPVGSQGKVLALIEDEASVLAGVLMLKRGCLVIPVMLTDVDLALLRVFACGYELSSENIASISEISDIAVKHKVNAVVLNDSFDNIREIVAKDANDNKTASFANLAKGINNQNETLPFAIGLNALILRPLSGLSKEEIKIELQYLFDANAT